MISQDWEVLEFGNTISFYTFNYSYFLSSNYLIYKELYIQIIYEFYL